MVARRELPQRRPDLPAGEPAPARAAAAGARQAAPARPLGHDAGAEPGSTRTGTGSSSRTDADLLCRRRPRPRRPGDGAPSTVARGLPTRSTGRRDHPRTAPGCSSCSRQFSFPGGVPSHVAPETPGSIHEGGELGYALAHAYGAALDNPDLTVACVIGDGEAETGPLAASWHANKFLNPATDGAVLPILHLNGWKIANPTVLARIGEAELTQLLEGYGHRPLIVSGDDPELVHQALAAALDDAYADIRRIQDAARVGGAVRRPRWPMIVLRTPKGWTGPHTVDGLRVEGYLALAPGAVVSHPDEPGAPRGPRAMAAQLPAGGAVRRGRPSGRDDPRAGALAVEADGIEPARQRRRAAARPLSCPVPRLRRRRAAARIDDGRGDPRARALPGRGDAPERRCPQLPHRRPRRDGLQPPGRRLRGHGPRLDGRAHARRRAPRSRRPGHGDPVGARLPGLARGLPADGPARPLLVLRGVRPHRRLDVQPACEVAQDRARTSPGGGRSRRSTTCSRRTCGRQDHNGSRTRTPGSSTTS